MGFTGTDRFNAAWKELHEAATAHPLVLGTVIAVFGLLVITGLYLYSARNRGWGLRLALWPCALLMVFGASWQWRMPWLLALVAGLVLAVELGWVLGARWQREWLRHLWRVLVIALTLGPFFAIRGSELRYPPFRMSDADDLLRALEHWRTGIIACRFGGLPAFLLVGSLVFLASVLLARRRQKAWPGPRWRAATIAVAAALPLWANWYVAGCLDPFTAVDDNRIGRLRYQVWSRPGLARIVHRQDQVPLINQAAMWGNVAAVRVLLDAGALDAGRSEDNHRGEWNPDPLQNDVLCAAAAWGEDDVVRLLLDRLPRASLSWQDAAEAAARRGQASTVQLLIKEHPELLKESHELLVAGLESPAAEEMLEVLMAAGLGVNEHVGDSTLFTIAAVVADADLFRRLLSQKAQVEQTDALGRTALHYAGRFQHRENLPLLLAAGAKVNSLDKAGATPLHLAAHEGDTDTVEVLLKAGANTKARDNAQRTPLHVVALAQDSPGAEWTPPEGPRWNNPAPNAAVLLAAGAEVNARDKAGATPLHLAARQGDEEAVKILLKAGADIKARDDAQRTPLHEAALGAREYQTRVLDVLIEAGAELNPRERTGATPLDLAIGKEDQAGAKALRAKGAKTGKELDAVPPSP